MSNKNLFEFQVEIFVQGATTEEIDQLARQLLTELHDLEVESVSLGKNKTKLPFGAKSADTVTIGVLAVAVLPTFLPKVIEAIQVWALRGYGKTVKFKGKINVKMIEFEGSSDDLEKIIKKLEKGKKK